MSVAAAQMPSLSTLLRLGRISNVPTVWTNVLAGSIDRRRRWAFGRGSH